MIYQAEKLPNEPITIWTPYEGWNWARDSTESNAKFHAIWNAESEQIYHVVNMLHIKVSLEDLMFAASGAARGEDSFLTHPKLRLVVIITQDPPVIMAITNMMENAKGDDPLYKHIPMMLMDSLEKALETIRADYRKETNG